MKPYQQRVVDEKKELDERLAKLAAFIGYDSFIYLSLAEQDRLIRQHTCMVVYSDILQERIDAFPKE